MIEYLDKIIRATILSDFPNLPVTNGDRTCAVTLILLILVIFALGMLIIYIYVRDYVDQHNVEGTPDSFTCIDKLYTGSQTSSGVGIGVGVNGAMPMVTSSTSGEKFQLVLKDGEGKIHSIKCSMQEFYTFRVNDVVKVLVYVGKKTNEIFKIKLAS